MQPTLLKALAQLFECGEKADGEYRTRAQYFWKEKGTWKEKETYLFKAQQVSPAGLVAFRVAAQPPRH